MKCPHCSIAIEPPWQGGFGIANGFTARTASCPSCGDVIVELLQNGKGGWRLAYPRSTSRSLPTEVPGDYAQDFAEAVLILYDSPKASAALTRRLLQQILREKAGIKQRTLADEIQKFIDAPSTPSHLAEMVDGVRGIGNFAAHPIKSEHSGDIVDVEPGEAEWLLDVLEAMFDFFLVQPERTRARRDALNAKLADAGRPPMK